MTAPWFAYLERLPLKLYHARLLKEVKTLVRDSSEAQDIVQDAWLRLFESIEKDAAQHEGSGAAALEQAGSEEDEATWTSTPSAQVIGWLRCACRCRAADSLRSRQRRQELLEEYQPEIPPPADPSEEIEREAKGERVRRVLRHLPRRQAQLLQLRSLDYSYHQTAAAIGVADASIGCLAARARSAFLFVDQAMHPELNGAPEAAGTDDRSYDAPRFHRSA